MNLGVAIVLPFCAIFLSHITRFLQLQRLKGCGELKSPKCRAIAFEWVETIIRAFWNGPSKFIQCPLNIGPNIISP